MPRPTVSDDCTEQDWSFFIASWGRYVEACKLDEGEEMIHLWSACGESLQKALHNQGATSSTSKTDLLDFIHQLVVKKRNNLVAVVEFQGMLQERDERVQAYLARLKGAAELCDLTVKWKCQNTKCQESSTVSFKDRFTTLQLVRGLADPSTQEKVLTAAAESDSGPHSQTGRPVGRSSRDGEVMPSLC